MRTVALALGMAPIIGSSSVCASTQGITERVTGGIESAVVGVDGHRSAEEPVDWTRFKVSDGRPLSSGVRMIGLRST